MSNRYYVGPNQPFAFDTPYVTIAEYSRRTGVPENTVRKYIRLGYLSVMKKEKGSKGKVLINLLAEARLALEELIDIDDEKIE